MDTVLLLPPPPPVFQSNSPVLYRLSLRIFIKKQQRFLFTYWANPAHLQPPFLICWDKTMFKKSCRIQHTLPLPQGQIAPRSQKLLLPVCVQHFKAIDIQQANDSLTSWILLKTQLVTLASAKVSSLHSFVFLSSFLNVYFEMPKEQITAPLRLEMTSKVIKSNHKPITTVSGHTEAGNSVQEVLNRPTSTLLP